MKKFLRMSFVLGVILVSTSMGKDAKAEDLAEIISAGDIQSVQSPYVLQTDLSINEETQAQIDNYISEDSSRQETVDQLVEDMRSSGLVTSEEMNKTVVEYIQSATTENQSLQMALDEAEHFYDSNPESRMKRSIDPVKAAQANWVAGAALVQAGGYPNTAMYMRHAMVNNPFAPAPAKHVSNNNAWANTIIRDNGLLGSFFSQYKVWVRGNAPTLTLRGGYNFNYGDPYYALHGVSYTFTFVRQANGSVRTTGVVTDLYDFKFEGYNNILTGFVNNYAWVMQNLRLIKPYNIEIRATF